MKTEAQKLIINAYKLGSEQTRYKLEQAFPEYFKTFENGDWIKRISEDIIIRITDNKNGFGYGFCGKWIKESDWSFKTNPENWKKATEAEVIEAFTKEFEKRGFKEGVKFNSLKQKGILTVKFKGLDFEHFFDKVMLEYDYVQNIYSKGFIIYQDGVFAEIVEEPKTLEERLEAVEQFINEFKTQ